MGQQKQLAHELALEWWAASQRNSGACDRCNAPLQHGEGYLCKPMVMGMNIGGITTDLSNLPDMICESCFDASPSAEPFVGDYENEKAIPLTTPDEQRAATQATGIIQQTMDPWLNNPVLVPEAKALLLLETCRITRLLQPELFPKYWDELKKSVSYLDEAGKAEYNKTAAELAVKPGVESRPGQAKENPQATRNVQDANPQETRHDLLETEAKLNKQWLPFGKGAAWKSLAEAWLNLDYQKTIALLKNVPGKDQPAMIARLTAHSLTEEDWGLLFTAAKAASIAAARKELDQEKPDLNLPVSAAAALGESILSQAYALQPADGADKEKEKNEQRSKNLDAYIKLIGLLEQHCDKSSLPLVSMILTKIDRCPLFDKENWTGRFVDFIKVLNGLAHLPAIRADITSMLSSQIQPQWREFALSHWYVRCCDSAGDVDRYAQELEKLPGISFFGRLWFLSLLVPAGYGAKALAIAAKMPGAENLVYRVRRALVEDTPETAAELLTADDFDDDVNGQFLLCLTAGEKAAFLRKITEKGSKALPDEMWSQDSGIWRSILPFIADSKSEYTPQVHKEAATTFPIVKVTTPEKQFQNLSVSLGHEFWQSEKIDTALLQGLVEWDNQAPDEVRSLLALAWKTFREHEVLTLQSVSQDETLKRCHTIFAADPLALDEQVICYIKTALVEKGWQQYQGGQFYTYRLKPAAPFIHLLLAAQKVSGVSPQRCDEILANAIHNYTSTTELIEAAAELYASDKGVDALTPPAKLKDQTLLKDWQKGVIRATTRKILTRLLIAHYVNLN